jgi:F-type H+-transporting ATPase subunit epsilon
MALHFELVSPAKLLFSGDVESVVIPGTEGEMTILPQHAPVLTTLKPGIVVVQKSGAAPERIFVRGGFAEVNPKGLTVLAERATPASEMTSDAQAQHVKDLEAAVAAATDEESRRVAQENLDHLKGMASAG